MAKIHALVSFLRSTTSLEHLELDMLGWSGEAIMVRSREFVDALRNNGSLQHVVIHPTRHSNLNQAEWSLIQSYCRRNEAIPTLAANVRLDKDDDDDKMDLSLLPTLFESAKQAPRTAPNAILIALWAAGDSIGPRWQYGIRSRPDESFERAA